MRLILVLILAFELLLFVLPTLTFVERVNHTNLASVLPGVLSALANQERQANNMPELAVSPILTRAAELKAQDMAEKQYFAHTSPEGKTPWYWLNQVDYAYEYAGENLAIDFSDSRDVTNAWMNSPTHRANIVKAAYTEVGTGIAIGTFEGSRTVFVAQVYANPQKGRESTVLVARAEAAEVSEISGGEEGAGETETETKTKSEIESEIELKNNIEAPSGTESQNAPDEIDEISSKEVFSSVVSLVQPEVLGAETEPTKLEKLIASPRHTANIIFLAIAAVLLMVVLVNVFVKMDVQHPDLITNGIFMVTVVLALILVNNIVGTKSLAISQDMDYSQQEVMDDSQTYE